MYYNLGKGKKSWHLYFQTAGLAVTLGISCSVFTWTCLYILEAPLHTGSLGKEDAKMGTIMSPVHPLLAPESSDKPVFRRPGFQGLQAGTG